MTLKFASRVSNLDLCRDSADWFLTICVVHKTLQSFVVFLFAILGACLCKCFNGDVLCIIVACYSCCSDWFVV